MSKSSIDVVPPSRVLFSKRKFALNLSISVMNGRLETRQKLGGKKRFRVIIVIVEESLPDD